MLRPRGVESMPRGQDDAGSGEADAAPELLDRYMRWLTVRDVRGTDLIEVRFTTPSPTLSAILTAAHTQAYLEANEEARLGTDATARHFLDRQLRESEAQLERARRRSVASRPRTPTSPSIRSKRSSARRSRSSRVC